MKGKYLFIYLLGFILLSSCRKGDGLYLLPANRTVIVYMAADNDLSDDAWDNIKEMQKGYAEKGVNLIVFVDPADDVPHILKVERGGCKRIKVYTEFNSADAEQMKQVLNDIIWLYPAENYGLVLWSHGTSWLPAGTQLRSFGEDKGRRMDISRLATALPVRFDFILVDACLMGAVEVAYQLIEKADFIIASPTEILYSGFPYEQIIPEMLQEKPDLKKVATSYFNYYDRLSADLRSASVSLINTRELERLAIVTSQLIADRTLEVGTFDRTVVQRLDVYEEQYTFDFLDFMEKAFPDVDISLLKEQLSKTVLYKAHTPRFIDEYDIRTCCGLSCYILHPQRNDLNTFYQQLDWCKVSGFNRLFSNSTNHIKSH